MSDTPLLERPPSLDPVACARWVNWPHTASPWLNEEVGKRMQARLQWIRLQPQHWVDWTPVSGGLQTHALVQARYPKAHCHVIEPNESRMRIARQALQGAWWQRLTGAPRLSFEAPPANSAQMVWANMALHTSAQPQQLLKAWHDLLATDGFLMFSGLGPDTLRELNAVYSALGWSPACHPFTDMHDWGDMLVEAGFAEPVLDMERLTLTYANVDALLAELRLAGRNLHRERFAALRGRRWLAQLKEALGTLAQPGPNGQLSLTVEVIYGHALKPAPRLKVTKESSISLQEMRRMLG